MQRSEKLALLLCTDMDRTVIPNGSDEEDPMARVRLRRFCDLPQIRLAYVSGRDMKLVEEGVHAYGLPMADFVISDVGTCICERINGSWHELASWRDSIAQDWRGHTHEQLQVTLQGLPQLQLQEPSRQSTLKLSYYLALENDPALVIAEASSCLKMLGVEANLVWSVDEVTQRGLLDVLPRRASKLHAIRYLQKYLGLHNHEVVFAGDSGNDLAVLTSDVNAVLVANASEDIRAQAVEKARANDNAQTLFLAVQQSALGMNGNYAAGVLQGVLHFAPHLGDLLLRTSREEE